jgi:peptide/nickel transport system substrate-binding protein
MGRALDLAAVLRQASPATRRELLKAAAAGGISAPVLAAMLARGGTTSVSAAPAAKQGEPVKGGTLVLLGHQEISSLHPDDMWNGPSIHWVMAVQMYNSLLEQDENFVFQPGLAEALPEISEDGLTYTFKLRSGVKFHNGEELTSADVKFSMDWYMDPANAAINAGYFANVESIEAPDATTIVIKNKTPNAAFFGQVADCFIFPAKYYQEVGRDGFTAAPIGTGPFKLKTWEAASYTEVERFDEHFKGAPNFDSVRLNVVPEDAQRTIGLETGEADSSVWLLIPEDNVRLAEDDNFITFITSSLAVNHFPLNHENPVLGDKSVRQGMLYAMDRQTIVDTIFQGTGTVATANLSPALGQYYTTEGVTQYPYDPAQAAAALEAGGWVLNGDVREKDGQKLSFTCTTITGNTARRNEAELVQQYFAEVGIEMNLEEAPVATILAQMKAGAMDASLFNWTYGGDDGDPDATGALISTAANNFSHYSNPRVDELTQMGLQEPDPEKRAPIYAEIQQIVSEDVPFLYVMFPNWYNHFNKRVKGLPESALTSDNIYMKAYTWWKEE